MMVLGTAQVKGQEYAIVESAEGGFINGIFSKYLLVPLSCVEKNIPPNQRVEIVVD